MSLIFGNAHKTFNVSNKLLVFVRNFIIVFNSRLEKKDMRTFTDSIGFFSNNVQKTIAIYEKFAVMPITS